MCKQDLVDSMLRYEAGEMAFRECCDFFQGLIDSGMAYKLQGCYGRQADAFIKAGHCKPAGLSPSSDPLKPLSCNPKHKETTMTAGTYKVNLKISDRKLYTETHEGRTTLKFRTVERWFNTSDEAADLFARWAAQGIAAKLGRYVGR